MPAFGFKERLAAGYAIILASAFMLGGGATYAMVKRGLDEQMRQTMLGTAEFQRNWPASYPPFVSSTTQAGPGVFYMSADGTVLYRSVQWEPPVGAGHPRFAEAGPNTPRLFFDIDTPRGPQRTLVAWLDPPYAAARIIEVTLPLAPLQTLMHQLLVWIATFSALATVVSMPLGMLLARRSLKPLSLVIDTAIATDAFSLDRRAPAPEVLDELGTLSTVFNRMLERLQAAFDRQKRFAEDASHELRTPLTVLRGEIELALRRERTTDEYRLTLANAHEEVERLQTLADGLLTLSQLDARPGRPASTLVTDLAATTRHLIARIAPDGADWQYTGASQGVWVPGPEDALERVVGNLLANLRQHAPGASATIALTVHEARARLVIEDDGPGLPAENTARVFERFFRGANARGLPGAGLGLAIARRIAEDAGGTLTAGDRPTGGARFELELPLAAVPAGVES